MWCVYRYNISVLYIKPYTIYFIYKYIYAIFIVKAPYIEMKHLPANKSLAVSLWGALKSIYVYNYVLYLIVGVILQYCVVFTLQDKESKYVCN